MSTRELPKRSKDKNAEPDSVLLTDAHQREGLTGLEILEIRSHHLQAILLNDCGLRQLINLPWTQLSYQQLDKVGVDDL